MSPREAWRDAINDAKRGRLRALKSYFDTHWPPPIEAKESFLGWLDQLDKEPSRRAEQLADAYVEYVNLERCIGYRAAFDAVRTKHDLNERVLTNVINKNRSDVNRVLQRRGII